MESPAPPEEKQKSPTLRSARWFRKNDLPGFIHRSTLAADGWTREDLMERPIVGILNTWSDLNPCNLNLRTLAQKVREGVLEAGGIPFELPLMSISENLIKPSAFPFRNLLAMDAEESTRGHPLDAVVLMGGCDRTQPGLLMGTASANVPAIVLNSGPGTPRSDTDGPLTTANGVRRFVDQLRAGSLPLTLDRFDEIASRVPLIANVQPASAHLTERLMNAGGVPAMRHVLRPLLHLDARTVDGQTIGQIADEAQVFDAEVIRRPLDNPVKPGPSIVVVRGNLAPDGAVIKSCAASPALFKHRGAAVVFDDVQTLADTIDDPALNIDANSVLILRNVGRWARPCRGGACCRRRAGPAACGARRPSGPRGPFERPRQRPTRARRAGCLRPRASAHRASAVATPSRRAHTACGHA